MNFTKSFRRGEKGFTLIELLIVIVILGILSAVAIPQVTKFIRSGKVSAANAELALVKTAMSAAMADAQISTIDDGTIGYIATDDLSPANDYAGLAVGPYIQGSYGALQGTYTFNDDGTILDATWSDTTITWDTPIANGQFQ